MHVATLTRLTLALLPGYDLGTDGKSGGGSGSGVAAAMSAGRHFNEIGSPSFSLKAELIWPPSCTERRWAAVW